jgi:hypothetical protein
MIPITKIIVPKTIIPLIFVLLMHKCFIASAYKEKPCSLFLLVLLQYSKISPERFCQSESLQRDGAIPYGGFLSAISEDPTPCPVPKGLKAGPLRTTRSLKVLKRTYNGEKSL